MKGPTTPMNIPETLLQALKRNQHALLIVRGSRPAALDALDELQALAEAEGLPLNSRRANGRLELQRPDGAGRVQFITERQISYGQLRGLNLHLVLHPDQKMLEDILPCLLTWRGLAVNYLSDEAAGPALADAMG